MLSGLIQDLRFALRSLCRQPVVLITTVLLLGLAIGASTVLFSAVNALMLRSLPVRQPEELLRFVTIRPVLGVRSDFDYKFLLAARERCQTVRDVFAWEAFDVALTQAGSPERLRANVVTGNYFQALGVPAALGRTIEPADDQPAEAAVTVLSDGFWKRRFGGDPKVLGRSIALNGHAFTIVGVSPAEFTGIAIETSPDLRLPLAAVPLLTGMELNNPELFLSFEVAARLRPNYTAAQARQEVASLFRAVLEEDSRKEFQLQRELDIRTDVEPLAHGTSTLRKQFGSGLAALMVGIGLLMIMVCANVAGLMLARSAARTQEWSVRLAVGASRWRLARLMLCESVLVAAMGISLGVIVAAFALPIVSNAIPPIRDLGATSLPVILQLRLDWRVLAYVSALGLLVAVGVGISPSWSASREDLNSVLRSVRVSRGSGGRSVIVALQVALCTLLLAGAGLFVETFRALQTLDPGFDAAQVATFGIDPHLASYTPAQSRDLQQRLLTQVRALPGVEAASIAVRGVMRGTGIKTTVVHVGRKATPADFLNASLNAVTPDYFETMGLRLLEGRNFREGEASKDGPKPIIVNRAFAQRFFPDSSAVGHRIGAKGESLIVGVVSDAKYRSLREPVQPTIYDVWVVSPLRSQAFIVHVRSRVRPEAIIPPVRLVLAGIDSRLPFFEITTLRQEVDRTMWQERMVAWMSLSFAVIAALLAGTGLYGLMSFVVAQRRREIGIRAALGARPSQIVKLVSRHSIVLTLSGAFAGLIAAAAALRYLRPLLYGVTGMESQALFAGAAVVVLAVLSTVAPAMRAAQIDPATTLRNE